MKKHFKLILAIAIAAVLAAVYFADFETKEPVPKNSNVVQKDDGSGDIKIKETYKPAHGDGGVAPSDAANEIAKTPQHNNQPQKQAEEQKRQPEEKKQTEEQKPSDTKIENKSENTCTLTVRCDTAIGKTTAEKAGIVPEDGLIFPETKAEIHDGDSVFDILLREMQSRKIHMEFSKTPGYDNVYIEGIGNLYEFDCGELSGWMYKVNDEFPKYGCNEFKVSPGDKIEFVYTCNLGRDIGGSNAAN